MIIGVTGSFGTGKSYVASVFKELGAKLIDADRIAHAVIKKGSPAYRKIISLFGEEIIDSGGNIDRRRLARKVFTDDNKVKKLNAIVHPEVIKEIRREVLKIKKNRAAVIDAPLLIEAGLLNIVDMLVVVKCSKKRQIDRCIKKFCIKKEEVLKRMRHQMPLRQKLKMANFVVKNDGTLAQTRKQVARIWQEAVWR